MQITEADKNKLIQLRQFRQFKWYVEKRLLKNGECFGETALHKNKQDYIHVRPENVTVVDKAGIAILSNADFFKVLQKSQRRMSILLKQIPFCQNISPDCLN